MKALNRNDPRLVSPSREDAVSYSGTLYVVSTPIGNLQDITLRALAALRKAEIIAAEKVSHTKGLCAHYGIKARFTSYNQHNQGYKAPELIRVLKSGKDVALVTVAGTPGISDPGVHLIDQAIRKGVKVTPVPGPSAVIAALSVSGLPAAEFVFLGFLSNRPGRRRKILKKLAFEERTMVFFEAPHRLREMLGDVKEILGDRQMVMLREMTKVYEELKRGRVNEILRHLAPGKIRGEITLVVAGRDNEARKATFSDEALKKIKALLEKKQMSVRDVARQVSNEEELPYRQVYRECLALKEGM